MAFSTSLPNLKKITASKPTIIPKLDIAELDSEGARAILMPDESIFSSTFFAVNRSFLDFFGHDKSDLQSSPFTILTGAITNTKQLQAMWAEVLLGSEETLLFNFYHKSGAVKPIILELIPRVMRPKQQLGAGMDGVVIVARIRESPTETSTSISSEKATYAPDAPIRRGPRRIRSSLIYDETLVVEADPSDDDQQTTSKQEPSASPEARGAGIKIEADKECQGLTRTGSPQEIEDSSFLASQSRDLLRPSRRLSCSPAAHAEAGQSSPMRTPKSRRASSALREAFPRAIAEAIMEGRRPEPIVRDCVSVFFSDIVGFTSLSSNADAAQVSSLLTRLFAKFDLLAQLHGVQKVDVIGDAYLAATNVLEDQAADHAARLARFAMDAVAAAAATRLDENDPASPAIQIRVGLHSGPASATVVGAQGFKYTIFGDTVNTASRMESTSLPGRIQCSAATAALIADQDPQVPLAAREGGVEAKGKGHMRTSWVGHVAGPLALGRTRGDSASAQPACSGGVAGLTRGGGRVRTGGGVMSFLRGPRIPAF